VIAVSDSIEKSLVFLLNLNTSKSSGFWMDDCGLIKLL
jgi:hypothetical protein